MKQFLRLVWLRLRAADLRDGIAIATDRREDAMAAAGRMNAYISAKQSSLMDIRAQVDAIERDQAKARLLAAAARNLGRGWRADPKGRPTVARVTPRADQNAAALAGAKAPAHKAAITRDSVPLRGKAESPSVALLHGLSRHREDTQ